MTNDEVLRMLAECRDKLLGVPMVLTDIDPRLAMTCRLAAETIRAGLEAARDNLPVLPGVTCP